MSYVPNMWNTYVLTASNLPHGFFFFFLSFSPLWHLSLGLALCALLYASRLHQVLILFFWFCFWFIDSLSFIWSFSRVFYFVLFYLFIYFFGFISNSLFIFLALSQVLRSVTSLVSGNFYQLLVYNSILVYLWFCICYGFDL